MQNSMIYFAFKWQTRGNTLQQQFQNTIEISYKDAKKYTPNTRSRLGTITSITSGLLKLVLGAQLFWWQLCPPLWKTSVFLKRIQTIYMTTSVSRRLNMLCYGFHIWIRNCLPFRRTRVLPFFQQRSWCSTLRCICNVSRTLFIL